MIKVLIIEDEQFAEERLKNLLNDIPENIEVITTLDSVESAINWLHTYPPPDLIFLDIQLSDGQCFTVFEYVQVQSPVIFTTAYDEYAIKAFEVNSIDYLLKPIKKEQLENSIKKYQAIKAYFSYDELNDKMFGLLNNLKSVEKNYKNRFLVNKGDTLIPIDSKDIAYFYTEDKAVFLVTDENKRFIINYTLDKLETLIDPQIFFRVNRQVIISNAAIKKISNYFNYKLKVDVSPQFEEEIVVSRTKVNGFKKWLDE